MADDEYVFVRRIFKGVNNNVSVVRKGEEEFITKEVSYSREYEDYDEMLANQDFVEFDIVTRLKHPNLINCVDFIAKRTRLGFTVIMVLEKADGDLQDYFEEYTVPLIDRVRMIYQLGSVLAFLRSQGLIHCDIKPENILIKKVGSENRAQLFLSDPGIARSEHSPISSYDYCQTETYRAPEYFYRDPKNWPHAFGEGQYARVHKRKIGFPVSESEEIPSGIYGSKMENVDLVSGEMWTFAWNAILILYSTSCAGIYKILANEFGSRNYTRNRSSDGYHYFVDILMKRPEGEDVGEYLYKALGHPPNTSLRVPTLKTSHKDQGKLYHEEEVVRILRELGELLDLDETRRPRTLSKFLESKIFCDLLFQCGGSLSGSNHSFVSEKKVDHKLINDGIDELIGSYGYLVKSMYTMFLAIEMYHRIGPEIVTDRKSMISTSLGCLFLAESSVTEETAESSQEWVAAFGLNLRDLKNSILRILQLTGGRLFDISLYDYLPSAQLLEKAMEILKDRSRYEELGGISGIKDFLLKNETPDEMSKRKPRNQFKFPED